MGPTIGVLLVAVSAAAAPHRGAPSPEAKPPTALVCPVEAALELLHDAVFHLDRGDDDARVRRDLQEARARIAVDDAGADWARDFFARIEAALELAPEERAYTAEVIRLDLHESPCLPKEVHMRFHRSLPAPGTAAGAPPRSREP